MKKIISLFLLIAVVLSCFTLNASAVESKNNGSRLAIESSESADARSYQASRGYCNHPYRIRMYCVYKDQICHTRVIEYVCDTCGGKVVNVETHDQVHADTNGDGYCDECNCRYQSNMPPSGGSGSGSGSGSSSGSGNSYSHSCALFDEDFDGICDNCGKRFTYCTKVTSTVTLKYKESISYKVQVNNLPEGASLALYDPESPYTPVIVSNGGYIGTPSATLKERYVAIYKVVDKNGNVLTDSDGVQTHYVVFDIEDSFFIRFAAFFKGIFGLNNHYDLGTYEINF